LAESVAVGKTMVSTRRETAPRPRRVRPRRQALARAEEPKSQTVIAAEQESKETVESTSQENDAPQQQTD
jgi:hypothetical protein